MARSIKNATGKTIYIYNASQSGIGSRFIQTINNGETAEFTERFAVSFLPSDIDKDNDTFVDYVGTDFVDAVTKDNATFTSGGWKTYTLASSDRTVPITTQGADRYYGVTATSKITVGVLSSALSHFTITDGTISNATYTYTPTDLVAGVTAVITIKAVSGYEFNTAPTASYMDTTDLQQGEITGVISGDKSTATITLSATDTNKVANFADASERTFTIDATAEKKTATTYNVSAETVTNCTYTESSTEHTAGTADTITFTVNDGYVFNSAPYVYYIFSGRQYVYSTISEDKKTATLTISADITEGDRTFYIVATADEESKEVRTFSINDTDDGASTVEHATYTPINAPCGVAVVVTVKADTGYEFKDIPYIIYDYDETESDIPQYSKTVQGVLSSDKTTATITLESSDTSLIGNVSTADRRVAIVYATATVATSVTYPFITLYNPTEDNLTALAKVRFYSSTGSYTDKSTLVDMGKYITSMKKFYCDVPATKEQNIILGSYDTGVSSLVVDTDKISIDCGSVTLESTNENNNDYGNTTLKVFLPFIGSSNIDARLVMNKTLHLVYKVSLLSGGCVATLYTDDIPLYTFSGNIAENVPYILNDNLSGVLGNLSNINSTVLQGFTPTITVMYHNNYNDNGTALTTDNKYTKLSELSGLNYVDDVEITSPDIDDDERDMIINMLRNGVYF